MAAGLAVAGAAVVAAGAGAASLGGSGATFSSGAIFGRPLFLPTTLGASTGGRGSTSGAAIRISSWRLRSMPASGWHTTLPNTPPALLSTWTTLATASPAG